MAIYDAANITVANRDQIVKGMAGILPPSHVIFIELLTDNEQRVDKYIRSVKLKTAPDYKGWEEAQLQQAFRDYKKRIAIYRREYVELKDKALSWIKLVDDGRQVVMNRIKGLLPGKIVHFVMNLHLRPRPIYLSRHGQSHYNTMEKIGGDSPLSPMGEKYAKALARWVRTNVLCPDQPLTDNPKHARLFTSSLRRAKDTVRLIEHKTQKDGWVTLRPREFKALDEIYAGVFDGMTYDQIKSKAPEQFRLRQQNKLTYRYPKGESYMDVITRLERAALTIEKLQDPVLVVAHQAVLRIIYAYFMRLDKKKAPTISIPLNTVIKLVPNPWGCVEERMVLINKENAQNSNNAPSH